MKKLEVKSLSNGFEIASPVASMTDEDFSEFQEIAASVLTAAFSERPLCVIGDEERISDWSYATAKMPQREIVVGAENFLTLFAFSPSIDFFRQVVKSSEFHWDALLFASFRETETSKIAGLIRDFDATDFPNSRAEILTSFNDGCGLIWLNPSESSETIFRRLDEITKSFDWIIESKEF